MAVGEADLEREQDIEELRRIALAQHAQIQQLIRQLQRKCDTLSFYTGNKNELQQTLALIEKLTEQASRAAAAARKPAPKAPPKKPDRSGPTEQPRLQRVIQRFELDAADRVCPSCGGELSAMGDQCETSEMIDVVEVNYRVVQVEQQKYVCRCGSCVETAPGPERAASGSRYSLALAVKVVLDKYLDHIPLERQVRIMDRHGLDITSQTLWDLANAIARRLERVDDALVAHVMACPVIGLDQTGWPRLDGSSKRPWQMWCLTAPGVVVHRIRDDKSAATFVDLVGDYRGTIVCDALKTHEAGAREGPGIVLAGCWAHVLRKFEEAMPDHPEAEQALTWIGALYDIDARAAGDQLRLGELRRTESVTVLAELKDWLESQAILKSLSIGKAAGYAIANWQRLTRFVEDPRIPLDNNGTERAIRGPVVGRKNHYGSKSRRGTEVAATLYTVLETAKLHDVDPAAYLRAAILAADRGEVLLPWHFAAQHAPAAP
ncbi:MAG TPA: IS66 family transposase [Burkholderiales bacterium]|nr:IS66 family transposase [Burkholderiales bacterium]